VFGVDAPPAVWVARRGRFAPVVGFLATRPTKSALEICGLAVEAEHRRAGIARALVRAAVRSARTRGYDALELHVATGNLAAVLLYESERFVKASLIDGFYASARAPSGGDAWRMVRELH
jgi:ribosomal protein S18 acetylase RimI-like enzyme